MQQCIQADGMQAGAAELAKRERQPSAPRAETRERRRAVRGYFRQSVAATV